MTKDCIEAKDEKLTYIRVWNPSPYHEEVGHVSLQTFRGNRTRGGMHVSYWPQRNPRNNNPDFTQQRHGVPGFNMPISAGDTAVQNGRRLIQDNDLKQLFTRLARVKKHGVRNPDLEIALYSLDIKQMELSFQTRIQKNPRWSAWGGSYFALPQTTNCSGLVNDILEAGGFKKLVRYSRASQSSRRYCLIFFTLINVLSTLGIYLDNKNVTHESSIDMKWLFFVIPMIEGSGVVLGGAIGGFYDGWHDTQQILNVADSINENHKIGNAMGTLYSTVGICCGLLSQQGQALTMTLTPGFVSGALFLGAIGLYGDITADEKDSKLKRTCKSNLFHHILLMLAGTVGFLRIENISYKNNCKAIIAASAFAVTLKIVFFGDVVCSGNLTRKSPVRWKDKISTAGAKLLGGLGSALCSMIGYDHSVHRIIILPEHIGQLAIEAKAVEEERFNLIGVRSLPPADDQKIDSSSFTEVKSALFRSPSHPRLSDRGSSSQPSSSRCVIL